MSQTLRFIFDQTLRQRKTEIPKFEYHKNKALFEILMEKIKLTIIFRQGFIFLNFFTCESRIKGTNPIGSVVTVYLLIFNFFLASCCRVSPGPKPVTRSSLEGYLCNTDI